MMDVIANDSAGRTMRCPANGIAATTPENRRPEFNCPENNSDSGKVFEIHNIQDWSMFHPFDVRIDSI